MNDMNGENYYFSNPCKLYGIFEPWQNQAKAGNGCSHAARYQYTWCELPFVKVAFTVQTKEGHLPCQVMSETRIWYGDVLRFWNIYEFSKPGSLGKLCIWFMIYVQYTAWKYANLLCAGSYNRCIRQVKTRNFTQVFSGLDTFRWNPQQGQVR